MYSKHWQLLLQTRWSALLAHREAVKAAWDGLDEAFESRRSDMMDLASIMLDFGSGKSKLSEDEFLAEVETLRGAISHGDEIVEAEKGKFARAQLGDRLN